MIIKVSVLSLRKKEAKHLIKARCKAMNKYKRMELKWALFEPRTHWYSITKASHYCLKTIAKKGQLLPSPFLETQVKIIST